MIESAPRFFRLVASGNDFIVADARALPGWDWGVEATVLACRRDLGFGADGVVTLGPSQAADATFNLRNRDGSIAAFSGNGARCAARLLVELGAGRDGVLTLEAGDRVVEALVLPAGATGLREVQVEIAPPRDVRRALRLPPGSPAPRGDYAVVGVPYLAVPVASVDLLDLPAVAPPLRRWKELPQGANVAFFEPPMTSGASIRLRTWERGVEGETLSSGTGCAIVAAALAWCADEQAGTLVTTFMPPSGSPMTVLATKSGDEITRLVLGGDARLLGELVPGPDLLVPGPNCPGP